MAEDTRANNPLFRSWRRISPGLVPVMAVITAFIIGIPFMIFTGARGDLGEGLRVSGTAYSALIEGSTGLVINDLVSRDNAELVFEIVDQQDAFPRDQVVPGLFERVRTGINGSPLSAVLDAIEAKSGVRILVDDRACAAKKIDIDTLSVSYPPKQTAWALILKSVVGRSHLTLEYRQDEAGTGFTFVAPFASYQPPAGPPPDGEDPENRP